MVSNYQKYRYEKHRIQEAVFEAKFSMENFDSTVPGLFYEKVRHEFPGKNDLKNIMISLGTAPADAPPIIQQAPTMQAWDDKRTKCLQLGPGIVSATILDYSYQSWSDFKEIINLLLSSYFQCTQPQSTKRVGVRYINRFVFPEEHIAISDYFKLNISLPELFKNVKAFDLNLINNHDYENYDITTKIKFSSDALRPGERGVAFILDLDSFVLNEIPAEYEEALKMADLCHDYLKAIFEDALQDKTRVLLGGAKI